MKLDVCLKVIMSIVKLFTVIDRYLPPPPPLDTNINLMTGIPARSDPWRLFRRQNQPGTSSGSDVCRCFRRKNIWSISVLLLDDAGRRLHIFFAWWGHPVWKLGCKNSCVYVREDYLFGQFYFFLIFYAREWDSASERATWLLNVFENLQSIQIVVASIAKQKLVWMSLS